MAELMYMVALPVPSPHRDRLSRIQNALRPPGWHITIGPHLTLVAPGEAAVSIDDARNIFSETTANIGNIMVDYPDIGSFVRRGLATLFLKPVSTDSLFELQRRLLIAASAWQDTSRNLRRPFVPHVTLVNRLPEAEAESVLSQLNDLAPLAINFGSPRLFAKNRNDTSWLEIV